MDLGRPTSWPVALTCLTLAQANKAGRELTRFCRRTDLQSQIRCRQQQCVPWGKSNLPLLHVRIKSVSRLSIIHAYLSTLQDQHESGHQNQVGNIFAPRCHYSRRTIAFSISFNFNLWQLSAVMQIPVINACWQRKQWRSHTGFLDYVDVALWIQITLLL